MNIIKRIKEYSVVGFDIDSRRIDELLSGKDHTFEIEESILLLVLKELALKVLTKIFNFL